MQTAIYKPANWLDPLDWAAVFGGPQPIEIDIGCGKGAFLLWAAQVRPQHNFVGVERQLVRLRKVDKKVQRAGLRNIRLLRIEAGYFVSKLVPNDSVSAYHIYFPDPWPKRRHHSRRLFKPAFVGELHRTLTRGGVVNVASDDVDYFSQIQKEMVESKQFAAEPAEGLPPEARTEFENAFLNQGKKIFRARFARSD
ncbi:MAG TPA: tRNA (guanosine(46)-N7)-methyltransferase TrmB [Verrucomicrobiae bacterium]|nr:tRNA (guanosine(46)-N7)-methyltransferase TrmB [Verrucomicrobiae bacterium]